VRDQFPAVAGAVGDRVLGAWRPGVGGTRAFDRSSLIFQRGGRRRAAELSLFKKRPSASGHLWDALRSLLTLLPRSSCSLRVEIGGRVNGLAVALEAAAAAHDPFQAGTCPSAWAGRTLPPHEIQGAKR
jgi:hypothetical protein